MKYLIVYSSQTGNTKKIANAILDIMPVEAVEIYSVDKAPNPNNYNKLILGYWVDKGTMDSQMKNYVMNINNKNIALFGTLGASSESDYANQIKANVEKILPGNNILGHFLSQGKINEKITNRLANILKDDPDNEDIKQQLKNHQIASCHPDDNDILNVQNYITKLFDL